MICDTKVIKKGKLKYNELVYRMTNRRDGFVSNKIADSNWFVPEEQTKDWYKLQSGLYLDVISTDYYVFLATSILMSHPDIYREYDNKTLTFGVNAVQDVKCNFTGGKFTTVGKEMGRMLPYRDVMPVPTKYLIRKKNTNNLLVSTDVGRNYGCEFNSFDRDGNSVLMVDWHERLPFSGPMVLDGMLSDASQVNIDYIPYGLDIAQWVKYIDAKMVVSNLLNKVNLFAPYANATSDSEKLALLIITLVLLNTSKSN